MNLKAIATTEEELSPEEYLNLSENEKANIKDSQIIPPNLGESGFGKIRVSYNTPSYKVNFKNK